MARVTLAALTGENNVNKEEVNADIKEIATGILNKKPVLMMLNAISKKGPLTKSELTASIGGNLSAKQRNQALHFLVKGDFILIDKPFQIKKGPSTSTIKMLDRGDELLQELIK